MEVEEIREEVAEELLKETEEGILVELSSAFHRNFGCLRKFIKLQGKQQFGGYGSQSNPGCESVGSLSSKEHQKLSL